MAAMNIFRVLADVSHTVSKCILIVAIHSNRSAEGVSLLTQLLYIAVFVTRYLDLFWVAPWFMLWNTILKIFYITSSAYIVFLMLRVFARTREKEYAWKLAIWSLGITIVTAPLICLIFEGPKNTKFTEVLWTFSIELESVAVLPQLLLLRQTSVPTVIDSFYLVTLGSYRFFYILSWIVRSGEEYINPISVIFGVLQTLLYVDFAWVYWTRQRVKLRYGGVVDGDDLSKSFLVRRFIGGPRGDAEEMIDGDTATLARQEDGVVNPPAQGSRLWGNRGISVSADDTLSQHDSRSLSRPAMTDPAVFEDDDFDDDADIQSTPAKATKAAPKSSSTPNKRDNDDDDNDGDVGSSAREWQANAGASHP